MNYEKWGRVAKWITIVIAGFFLLMVMLGIYMGVTGQQDFTFSNQPEEATEQSQSF